MTVSLATCVAARIIVATRLPRESARCPGIPGFEASKPDAAVGAVVGLGAERLHPDHIPHMTDPTAWLSTALADRYRIERELGQGGMASRTGGRADGQAVRAVRADTAVGAVRDG